MTRNAPGKITIAVLALAGLLAACDGGPASQPARPEAAAEARQGPGGAAAVDVASAAADAADGPAPSVDPRTQPVPLVDGKPMWAPSRRRTAEEAATRQFERNGDAFGARSLEDYVRKAQAFVTAPPAGSETVTRPNGDRLIYDPKGNIFAVASKDGAPRAMFKPDDGAAYWEKTKAGANQPRRPRRERPTDDQG